MTRSRRSRRAARLTGAAVAAGIVATSVLFGASSPALAWGQGTIPAPYGCTGQANAASWLDSGFVYSITWENGNWCWPGYFGDVEAGLWRSGSGPVFVVSRAGYAEISGTQGTGANTFYGGYHAWGYGIYT